MHTQTVSRRHSSARPRDESKGGSRRHSLSPAAPWSTLEAVDPRVPQSLSRSLAYPDDPSAVSGVERIQTHISDLFLTGDRVYKLRKAVDLGFVDFTSRSERNADCVREVELNRRLAPDVYLGVAPLEQRDGGFVVGKLVDSVAAPLAADAEHCVVMRRLPARRDALTLLSDGRLTRRQVDAAAERIAYFHQANRLAPRLVPTDREIRERITGPFKDCILALENAPLHLQVGNTLRVIDDLSRAFLDARWAQMRERARRGRWVEGHGDLHLQHLWFEQGRDTPVVIDCLEFREDLRQIDAAADVAFLAMDLAYRGREEFAERLLGRYADLTDDFDLFWVVDYFRSYRAVVRAKVAAIAWAESALTGEQRQAAVRSVERHLSLAERILRKRSHGSVALLCGKVGTGKSTVAKFLAENDGGILVSSDRLRKRLAGLPSETRAAAPTDTGLYALERIEAIYEAMLERAAPVVGSGRLAVLDATFNTAARRDRARRWAGERRAPVLLIEVECEEETALERLARRVVAGATPSDAGPDFYATSTARFEPPDEWPRGTRVQLRTDSLSWRADLRQKLGCWLRRNLGS